MYWVVYGVNKGDCMRPPVHGGDNNIEQDCAMQRINWSCNCCIFVLVIPSGCPMAPLSGIDCNLLVQRLFHVLLFVDCIMLYFIAPWTIHTNKINMINQLQSAMLSLLTKHFVNVLPNYYQDSIYTKYVHPLNMSYPSYNQPVYALPSSYLSI